MQHYKSGLEDIATGENLTDLEKCLVQIELPIQTETGEKKELKHHGLDHAV